MRRLARLWPIALTVAIFVVIFLRIPFERFREALSGARLFPFLGLMASFSVFYFLIDTYVLSRMIRWFHGPLAYRDLLPARASTYLVSIVNTQLAQGALALYIRRRFGTPLAEIGGTVGLMILLEVTQLVIFATVGMLTFSGSVPRPLFYVPVVLAAFWGLLLLVARGGLRGTAGIGQSAFFQTFRRARSWQLLAILGLKAPTFIASLLVHRVALTLFDIHIPTLKLLACLPIVYLVAALPVTVAHLGTSQAAWIFFFNDHAAEADLLAYSLASHLTFMLANGTLGLVFLPRAYAELFGGRRSEVPSTSSV